MTRFNKWFLIFPVFTISILALIIGLVFSTSEKGAIVTTGEIIKIDTYESYDVDNGTTVNYIYHVKYQDANEQYHIAELQNYFGSYDLHEIIEIKYKPTDYNAVYGNGGNYSNYLIYGGIFGSVICLAIFILKFSYYKAEIIAYKNMN